MTSKSQYENFLGAFAPHYYDDENTYIHTYIHRLYLKHGKPSVILHNKYSLNYSKLKNIWIHIVYIYI